MSQEPANQPAASTYPRVVTELPAPLTRALLERKDRVLTAAPRLVRGAAAVARRHEYVIEDLDGNTFADHVSAWARPRTARSRRPCATR